LSFDLEDENGSVLLKNQHLLSLKDMNRSAFVGEMLDAGVRSFKIEGRLKDESYVRNVTAYYRRLIDKALQERKTLKKASKGVCSYTFEPNLEKTFHRGSTDYFLSGNRGEIWNFETPKSIGETIGYLSVSPRGELSVNLKDGVCLHNGDGCCIRLSSGETKGFRVNRVDGNRLFPQEMPPRLMPRTKIYRNFDQKFEQQLSRKSAERRIRVEALLTETPFGFALTLTDEDDVPDAMARLQQIYKNALELRYDNARTRESAAFLGADTVEQKSAFELFSEFFAQQNNAEMTAEQSEFMRVMIEEIEEGSV
jgi:putative protease